MTAKRKEKKGSVKRRRQIKGGVKTGGVKTGGVKTGGDCGCNKHIFNGGAAPLTPEYISAVVPLEQQTYQLTPSQNSMPTTLIKGGVALGGASLTNFDPNHQYSYDLNTHQNDPLAPSMQDATRMDPNPIAPWNPFLTGGKKSRGRRNKSNRKRNHKRSRRYRIKGGDALSDSILNGPTFSAGTVMGAPIGANIITGNNVPVLNPPTLNSAAPFI